MPRRLGGLARARGEKALGDAVFQRMEGDDQQPATLAQDLHRRDQPSRQFAQLVIHEETQRLEAARRRVLRIVVAAWNDGGYHIGLLKRALKRLFRPAADYGPRD